jgi:hypothetical protein
MLRVGSGWPMCFWDPYCQDASRVVVARRIDYVAEVIVNGGEGYCIVVEVVVVEEFGCVVEVVDGWCWVDAAFG